MKKVMINKCYGGFGFSRKAIQLYIERKGLDVKPYFKEFSGDTEPVLVTWELYKAQIDTAWNYHLLHDNGTYFSEDEEVGREDDFMIAIVEELGKEANGQYADIRTVEIMDDEEYEIHDYDGVESLTVGFGLRHI